MWNLIHIILEISYFGSAADNNHSKSGVMGDVAASANDPIFLNHHAMVDCIFETWLQKNPHAQYPISSEIPKGHWYNDYIVSFWPLYKHSDNMFFTADKFRYQCAIKPVVPGKSKELRTIIVEVLGPIRAISAVCICVVIIGVVLGCCVKKYRHKSRNNPTYTHMPSQTEHGTTNEETVPLHIRRSHDKWDTTSMYRSIS